MSNALNPKAGESLGNLPPLEKEVAADRFYNDIAPAVADVLNFLPEDL